MSAVAKGCSLWRVQPVRHALEIAYSVGVVSGKSLSDDLLCRANFQDAARSGSVPGIFFSLHSYGAAGGWQPAFLNLTVILL